MRRSRFVLGAIASASVGAAIVACSFPDVTFTNDADVLAPHVPDGESPVDSGSDALVDGGDGGVEGNVDPELSDAGGEKLDASELDPIDASSCNVTDPCDCDKDEYQRLDLDAGCDGGAAKSRGFDCDDRIAGINPGRTKLVKDLWPKSTHPLEGDWNCDGQVQTEFYTVNCSLICTSKEGVEPGTKCGTESKYITCTGALPPLLCSPKQLRLETQGCL